MRFCVCVCGCVRESDSLRVSPRMTALASVNFRGGWSGAFAGACENETWQLCFFSLFFRFIFSRQEVRAVLGELDRGRKMAKSEGAAAGIEVSKAQHQVKKTKHWKFGVEILKKITVLFSLQSVSQAVKPLFN